MNPHPNLINMKNGVFNIDTLKFSEHSKEYMSTIQIPVEYIVGAMCPRFEQYLDEVFEYDLQRQAIAQEWFGYSMTTETKAQKALILYGSGGNGKGVFTEILSTLIGDDNISNIPLNELNKGFSRVCIFGKTANISNENETYDKAFNTQYFKAIVGEDRINAEEKGKPVFSFKPTCKLILSVNNLPSTKDKSEGYYRRLSILNFTAHFDKESRDNDLKDKLLSEILGIFLWAIEGLKRLRSNNFEFSHCKNMENTLNEYKSQQNPMIGFFDELVICEPDKNHREDANKIYETFKNWCKKNGHSGFANISTHKFWSEFKKIAKEKGYPLEKKRSNTHRYCTGIRLIMVQSLKAKKVPAKSSISKLFKNKDK